MNRRAAIVALVSVPAVARGIVVEAATPGRFIDFGPRTAVVLHGQEVVYFKGHRLSAALAHDFSEFQLRVKAAQRALLEFEAAAKRVGVSLANMERAFSRHG